MKIKTGFIKLIFVWAGILVNQSYSEEKHDYAWPIDLRGDISGNFAECRLDHFHAGLDIATGGVKGYKLYAVDDGYLWRVRASVVGYGKAVYLKLRDGRYVVYAHMDEFIKPVSEYVRHQQKKSGKYELDIMPEPGMFRFRKGDVVGYSGNSGDVAPHLHIELRDERENPINILSAGLKLPYRDTTYPRIKNLAVKPFGSDSMVDQGFGQVVLFPQKLSFSEYVINSPIPVWGKIGFKLNYYDTDQFKQVYKLNIHNARLIVGGNTVFSLRFDEINYDFDYNSNFFLYDRELKYMVPKKIKGDYVNFFSPPGISLTPALSNDTPGYVFCGDPKYSAQPVYLPEGDHGCEIEVTDASGNTSRILFTLRVKYPDVLNARFVKPGRKKEGTFTLSPVINYYDSFFSVVLNTYLPPQDVPEVMIETNTGDMFASRTIVRESAVFEYLFTPQAGLRHPAILKINALNPVGKKVSRTKPIAFNYIPETGGKYVSPDKKVSLKLDSNNVPLIITSQTINVDLSALDKKITKESKIYEFRPKGFQLSNRATLEFKIDNVSKLKGNMAVFEFIDNKWKLNYPLVSERDDIVLARIDHLSTFAVFADPDPPVVAFIYPKNINDIVRLNTDIICRVDDLGVGIAYKKLDMKINGKSVPAEYIDESKRFVYKIDEPLNSGTNTLEVTAEDRLGLVKTKSIKFIFKN